tara:strand:+ start:5875 stop:8502 length:2628 start_codon:yes stop_codon:yes gene_type:complete
MGLLGKSFRDFVGGQIDVRQIRLGEKSSRHSSDSGTKAFLTNTPWIRLASSVNLNKAEGGVFEQMESSDLFENPNNFMGSGLAKNFVLFGGVNNNKGGISNAHSGLNSPNSKSMFGGAYGFGSWDKLFNRSGEGYKPMPGITNMDFSYKNDGALSQGTVTIKAFSRAQFQIIDVLFQRPGYTVLLEFGHSVFVDNDGNTQYAGTGEYSYSTDPFNALFDPNSRKPLNNYNLTSLVNEEKRNWHGNYEGAFMKIAKFNWKYNMDGSYDITVNLVGLGDVISSLKAKVLPLKRQKDETTLEATDSTKEELKEMKEGGNFLVANSQSSKLNQELYKIYQRITKGENGWWDEATGYEGVKWGRGEVIDFPTPIYKQNTEGLKVISDFKNETLKIKNAVFTIINPDKSQDVDGYDNMCYITFGYLISLITKCVNLKDSKGIPHLSYDFNYTRTVDGSLTLALDENFLATYPGNMSSDPTKVLIPFISLPPSITNEITDSEIQDKYKKIFTNGGRGNKNIQQQLLRANDEFFVSETSPDSNETEFNGRIGRLDRVYLDINFIAKVLDDNTSKDENKIGECSLIDVLKQILEEINGSLGGINEFRIMYDQETQLIKFVSEVPVNTPLKNEDSLAVINVSGLEADGGSYYKGSFVKSVDLKAELNDDFASLISIGAQANPSNLQGNAGAFGRYNRGLIDRTSKEKLDIQANVPDGGMFIMLDGVVIVDGDIGGDPPKSPIKAVISSEFLEAITEIYRDFNFTNEYIDIVKQYNSSLSPFVIGKLAEDNLYPTPFFLPFNLGLTLHGLGGVRIYDGFKIDGKILPPSYDPTSISLIIKSLSHSVSLDGWVTKIETIPKPIFKEGPLILSVGDWFTSGFGSSCSI